MIAALYSMKFTDLLDEKNKKVKEFIVYGNDQKEIASYAEAVRAHNENENSTATLDGPFYLDNTSYGEDDKHIIDWAKLSLEVEEKRKRRPKNLGGCIFRGMGTDEAKKDWDEYNEEFKESISYFLPEHRSDYYGEEFYFVGAMYDDKAEKLTGNAIIIEANNLEHAADI